MNFKEWEEKAVSEYTCEFGRDWIRDIYTLPCGIKIYHETCLPRHIFAKQKSNVLVDLIYHKNCLNFLEKENINKNNIFFDENRYTEENYGYIVFTDYNLYTSKENVDINVDILELAYNFCESGKARKLLNHF